MAEEPATLNVTPLVLPVSDAKPPTSGVRDQLKVPKSPQAAPTQTPLGTRPVRRRARPGYLKNYLYEL